MMPRHQRTMKRIFKVENSYWVTFFVDVVVYYLILLKFLRLKVLGILKFM